MRIMNFLLLIGAAFLSWISASGQSCGTTVPAKYNYHSSESSLSTAQQSKALRWIPLKINIIRDNNGSSVIKYFHVLEQVEIANQHFRPINVQFYICGPPNYINNSQAYFNWSNLVENQLSNQHDEDGVINVYYTYSVNTSGLCAYAYFPGGPDRIIMSAGCADVLLTHELGHYFNLLHTHHNGNELVDGSNCQTAGDLLCDTPADPNLAGLVTNNCQYTGTATDANGMAYQPMVENIMSYSNACRDSFTAMQYARMKQSLEEDRFYLRVPLIHFDSSLASPYCVGDAPVNLTATPSGGSFSGKGVSGAQFYPQVAGKGVSAIHYTYIGNTGLTKVLDQKNTFYDSWQSMGTSSAWQSMTYGASTHLKTITVRLKANDTTMLQYKLYGGMVTSGNVYFHDSVVVYPGNGQWVELPFSFVNINQNGQGAIWLKANKPGISWSKSSWNKYGGGESNISANEDYSFISFIEYPETTCGDIFRVPVKVSAPDVALAALPEKVCPDADTIRLKGIPSGSIFSINGIEDSLFVPANLKTGMHKIKLIYTDVSGFTASDSARISIPTTTTPEAVDFKPYYCLDDPSDTLEGAPAGGIFYIDNQVQTIIDPAAMGVGKYAMEYIVEEVLDTFSREWEFVPNANFQHVLSDQYTWQSFKPKTSGMLNRFNLIAGSFQQDLLQVRLLEGKGLQGQQLDSTQLIITPGTFFFDPGFSAIHLDSSKDYTLTFRKPSNAFPNSIFMNKLNNDPYPAGSSSEDSNGVCWDFKFNLVMDSLFTCQSSWSDSLEIVPPFKVDLGNDTMIIPGSTLLLDAGIPNATYLWSSGNTMQQISIAQAGNYWVNVEKGCFDSDTIEVEIRTGINETNKQLRLAVSPNPARESIKVNIENPSSSGNLSIFDMQGRVIRRMPLNENRQFVFDMANWNPGVYMIMIQDDTRYEYARFILQ